MRCDVVGVVRVRELSPGVVSCERGGERGLPGRRRDDVRPPALARDDPRHPRGDPRYAALADSELPLTECLKDTVERFLPYWKDAIAPAVRQGKRVIIVAHGNSLRALIKYLDGVSDQEIVGLNVPTGRPLVYELDAGLKPVRSYYLGDQTEIAAAMPAVAHQAKVKP